jgi:hypothetical protein
MRPLSRLSCFLVCLISCGPFSAAVLSAKEPSVVSISPTEVRLQGPKARYQLLVRKSEDANRQVDVTRAAEYRSLTPEICTVSDRGIVSAEHNGRGEIEITLEGETHRIAVSVDKTDVPRKFNFERDIMPIFSRYGCNSAGCHGKAEGQNGFKLSVFGFDPAADHSTLLQESRGRRLSLSRPAQSLLLTKASGGVPHGGGIRIKRDSVEYEIVRDWIRAGAPFGEADDPQVVSIQISPGERRMLFGEQQQLRVVAEYSDGQQIDVTPLAKFQSNNDGLASVDEFGLVTVGKTPGDVAVMAEFMGRVDLLRVLIPQPESLDGLRAPPARNFIDELVDAKLERLNMVPSELCSDADFLRRVSLDITGTLPTAGEARRFLDSPSENKRQELVDELLRRPAYADFQALKWADLLRVDRNALGHRGAYNYYRWIRDSFAENKSLDQFARELLTAKGPLTEQPAGHLYRAVSKPGDVASTLSQVLLGVRIECAQCHHHPFDRWSQTDYAGMQAFFVQKQFKSISAGDILYISDKPAQTQHPRSGETVFAFPLGETQPAEAPTTDSREVLADWMTAPDNPWFARNVANRTWAQFLGRGLVEPVDDVRLTNPPSNPELLDALADYLVQHDFDLHELIRAITNSRTYQLSSKTNRTNLADEQNYSRALLRPLQAEVLLDAISDVTGVPEKFDGVAEGYRAIQLWDSHVPHDFLKSFGRPTRATACECERVSEPTISQVLKMMNSPHLQAKLSHSAGRVAQWEQSIAKTDEMIDELYLTCFSRFPTDDERKALQTFFEQHASRRQRAIEDAVWSLMNTTEFLFNH